MARIPKKTADQATFNINWIPNSSRGSFAPCQPACRQTIQLLTAIIKYKNPQIGPKIQLGGFQEGRCSCGYHVCTDFRVKSEPVNPAAKHTTANGSKDSHESRSNISGSSFQPTC